LIFKQCMNRILYDNIRAMSAVDELARSVSPAAIYLLKGAAIINISPEAVATRLMEDTDILVDDYAAVSAVLIRMGFAKRTGDSQTFESVSGTVRPFDVHTNLWYASSRDLARIKSESASADGIPPNARIFSAADLCADIIIHAAQHGGLDGRWRGDLEVIENRFGPSAVREGRARAEELCPGLLNPASAFFVDGAVPSAGFVRRFGLMGSPKKKAAYAAGVLFPSEDFIARRYDASSRAGVMLRRFVRPFAILAAAAGSLVCAAASSIIPARRQ